MRPVGAGDRLGADALDDIHGKVAEEFGQEQALTALRQLGLVPME
jgi:hypothetical protein